MSAFVISSDQIHDILVKRVDHQQQSVGLVAGVVDPNGRRVVAHGHLAKDDPRPVGGDTIFEIGSLTKIFTSLLLADMVHRQEVTLDDPAGTYLPDHVTLPERGGRSITLRDLSTHHSGLPQAPANMTPKAEYSVDDLYAFLSGYTLPRDPGSTFEYSNLGAGLLGHLLARRLGISYEQAIDERITRVLGMRDTGITPSPAMTARMATGHSGMLAPVAHSQLPTLAGAGALRSSATDLLTLLEGFLGYSTSPLAPAMKTMLDERRPAGPGTMGLGWPIFAKDGREFAIHSGAIGDFRSFAGFAPRERTGVVVLCNASTPIGVEDIGMHLLHPALPLANPEPPQPRTEVAVDPAVLEHYVGRYQMTAAGVFEVTRDGGRLFAQTFAQLPHHPPGQPTAGPKFELFAEEEHRFFAKVANNQVTFEVDPAGRATGLVLHRAGRDIRAPRVT